MTDSILPTPALGHFHLENLPEDALMELSARAQRNGRTIHEEAEYTIRQHLAASDGNDG